MEELVTINNLSIFKSEKPILKNISLSFYKGINTFLCGTCASGKTSLLKAIKNNNEYNEIKIEGNVAVLLENEKFLESTVEKELKYYSLSLKQQQFIQQYFDSEKLKQNPNALSFYEQKVLLLCTSFKQKSEILFIDNLYSYLNKFDLAQFKSFFQENAITVVLVSTDIEQALDYEYMVVMDKGKVAIEGKTLSVLLEEKLLKRLGIGLPFYVDLSLQLKSYGLIHDIYLNKEDMAGQLWK